MSPREGAVAIDDLSHWGTAAWLQVAAIIAIVVILHVPLGNYMASVYTATGNSRVERAIYRIVGVQPHDRKRWTKYLSSLLAFSAVSVLALYGILLFRLIYHSRGVIKE